MTWHVILRPELIVTHIFLVVLESPAFRKKTGLYQANEEAKVEPHTPYTLNVFPTQMRDYLPFLFYDCGVHAFPTIMV